MVNSNWIDQFVKENGRPPRILHIGNIANNAYQTAKMLNAAGADCDVLCADYYHMMGAPEWDDSDFTGDIGDDFFPAWHKVDLHGFVRPRWFAQGPRNMAIQYLVAMRKGQVSKADRLWNKMEIVNRTISDQKNNIPAEKTNIFFSAVTFCYTASAKLLSYLGSVFSELFSNPATFFKRLRMKLGLLPTTDIEMLREHDAEMQAALRDRMPSPGARVPDWVRANARDWFPTRDMPFGSDADCFVNTAQKYKKLLSLYDIVQAYAVETIWPYLCGCKNYVAWEHGTLRDTPYEDNDRARLLLLSYAAASVVYVTNVDCYDSAVYITKHTKTPIVCGLHGFDTERMMEKQKKMGAVSFDRGAYAAPDVRLFFCPARVDIDAHYGTYLKRNDMMYRALYRLWQEKSGSFKVLQLEWGNDTAALKQLIHEDFPEMEAAIIWHPPFSKGEFYQILQHAELVFDNFLLPLMGGNGIETLMSGHAALVNKRIPEELMLRFFPEMWSILPVDGEDGIYEAAKLAVNNPVACREIAKKGQAWILNHHNHDAIVTRNLQSYQIILPMPV